MRRSIAIVAAMVWVSTLVFAQGQKVTTPEEFDKVMKKVGPAMQGAGKAIGSGAFADAKTQLAAMKAALTDASTFWATHKKADAQKMTADAIAKVDALDKAISAPSPDPAAVKTAQGELQGTCRACHTLYRVQDPATNAYSIKPGTIGG